MPLEMYGTQKNWHLIVGRKANSLMILHVVGGRELFRLRIDVADPIVQILSIPMHEYRIADFPGENLQSDIRAPSSLLICVCLDRSLQP